MSTDVFSDDYEQPFFDEGDPEGGVAVKGRILRAVPETNETILAALSDTDPNTVPVSVEAERTVSVIKPLVVDGVFTDHPTNGPNPAEPSPSVPSSNVPTSSVPTSGLLVNGPMEKAGAAKPKVEKKLREKKVKPAPDPRFTGVTPKEGGLKPSSMYFIIAKAIHAAGEGGASIQQIKGAVNAVLAKKEMYLSEQGYVSVRRLVNHNAVGQGYLQEYDGAGWKLTDKGRALLEDF